MDYWGAPGFRESHQVPSTNDEMAMMSAIRGYNTTSSFRAGPSSINRISYLTSTKGHCSYSGSSGRKIPFVSGTTRRQWRPNPFPDERELLFRDWHSVDCLNPRAPCKHPMVPTTNTHLAEI